MTTKTMGLEEEVADLRTRKPCRCGEVEVSKSGSGSQEDPLTLDLEYAGEEEELNWGLSYHTSPVAQDLLLHIFSSPVFQVLPDVPEVSCACLVPAIIRIKDGVEITTIPRENKELVSVQVERLLLYPVGLQ